MTKNRRMLPRVPAHSRGEKNVGKRFRQEQNDATPPTPPCEGGEASLAGSDCRHLELGLVRARRLIVGSLH